MEYNISELKQITESSNIKADADPNKLHYDELRAVTKGYTREDAEAAAGILARKYPDILFEALSCEMLYLKNTMSGIKNTILNGEKENV